MFLYEYQNPKFFLKKTIFINDTFVHDDAYRFPVYLLCLRRIIRRSRLSSTSISSLLILFYKFVKSTLLGFDQFLNYRGGLDKSTRLIFRPKFFKIKNKKRVIFYTWKTLGFKAGAFFKRLAIANIKPFFKKYKSFSNRDFGYKLSQPILVFFYMFLSRSLINQLRNSLYFKTNKNVVLLGFSSLKLFISMFFYNIFYSL